MRRRIFTLLLLLGAAVMVQAQSPKMWIGGSMDIATTKSGTVKTGAISFMPEFGYVVNEKVKVGAGVGYTTVYTHVTSDDKSSDNIFSIKLFGRYTLANLEKWNIFGQADLPIRFYSGKNFDGSSMSTSNDVTLNVRPGIAYSINSSWGATLLMPPVLSYGFTSNDTSGFNFGINNGYTIQRYLLNTSIGLIYKF